MTVMLSGRIIDASPLQSGNAYSPMEVTESGIVIDVSDRHNPNAQLPMEVTEGDIDTVSKRQQEVNAESAIFVMDSEMVIDVSFLCLAKARMLMAWILLGIL